MDKLKIELIVLVLCKVSYVSEFQNHFGSARGPRRKDSRSYPTDEERRTEPKGPGIIDRNLLYRALLMLILCSCNNTNQEIGEASKVAVATERVGEGQGTIMYLSQAQLTEYVLQSKTIEITSAYTYPFDTLQFDKVIAYDFDGSEQPYPSVINQRNGKFVPVISRQQELKAEQIDFLIDFLTDNSTYGEPTAACFYPHLGIVFYQGNERKYVVDICLDCNYLRSTTEIPATQHKKMKFDDGTSYGLQGFSGKGKEKIIQLSKRLGLAYGAVEHISSAFDYDTPNDSARYYFLKGWQEIMDNGRWTKSEAAFRKAVEFDSNWVLGKSMIGRITRNLEERQTLLEELEMTKDQASEDGRLLVDVNLLSLKAANNRDQGIKNSEEFNNSRKQLAEINFGRFSRKYPDDNYFKAEYIEFLHANHGASVALDSLHSLATAEQMKLGFYISYSAILELELGNIEKAITLSEVLEETIVDPTYTGHLMLQAQIYMAQDSLQKAKEYIDKVVKMDPKHMIALSTQSQIDRALEIDY